MLLMHSNGGLRSTLELLSLFNSFIANFLSGLCQRRQWPEPSYEPYVTRAGIKCVVRVNNREYHTDGGFENDVLASESAAMRAYLICRNFSVNDGMYPAGHSSGGTTQGLPVAIGRERRRPTYGDDWTGRGSSSDWDYRTMATSGSSSGGSSPGSDRFTFVGHREYPSSSRRTSGRR